MIKGIDCSQMQTAIRRCSLKDRDRIVAIINDAAAAYRSVVPERFLIDPYMSAEELTGEMHTVLFYGYEDGGRLAGVMGIEPVKDVTLLRHAYVRTSDQRRGIGGKLLRHVESLATTGWLMLGTWATSWAVNFYLKHGFAYMPKKDRLLSEYWPRVSQDQAANSVVMGKRLPSR